MTQRSLLIGMNDRLFASNWRPILEDIAFAAAHNLRAIQFHGRLDGLSAQELGASLDETGAALRAAGIMAVMEILIFVDEHGMHESGKSPLDILRANLAAIEALGCVHVHWHLAARPLIDQRPSSQGLIDQKSTDTLEIALVLQFQMAMELAVQHGFQFAFEQNELRARPFNTPKRVAALLDAVPGLGFVWDLNHASASQVAGYQALARRMTMLHVADTPLPDVNYHLPLGMGTIDFNAYLTPLIDQSFCGPAILEIGGLPKSGGYGRDTDAALIASHNMLLQAIN